ncbi:MAG: hypothetical protein Kow0069_19640 [Promethearchaeota archaeon]
MKRRKFDPAKWRLPFPNKQHRENWLRAVERRHPRWIPCSVSIFPAVWVAHREALRGIVRRHPFVFGSWAKFYRGPRTVPAHHRAGAEFTDNWGCAWKVAKGGYEGQVVGHPLADWSAFENYEFPDPLRYSERGRRNWAGVGTLNRLAKLVGLLRTGPGDRLFDRLYFLRGFDNLMRDFATNDPRLPRLVRRLEAHSLALTRKVLSTGVDVVAYHTDIGTQDRLMVSPRQFRRYLKPTFRRLFQTCRGAGVHVYLSSDGHLLDIVDDLAECGVSVHDPQERANTLEGIAEAYAGKLCVDLDLDRQALPFEGPDDVERRVARAVETLGSPQGGLMLKAEVADPNVPMRNVEALCRAFERYCVT